MILNNLRRLSLKPATVLYEERQTDLLLGGWMDLTFKLSARIDGPTTNSARGPADFPRKADVKSAKQALVANARRQDLNVIQDRAMATSRCAPMAVVGVLLLVGVALAQDAVAPSAANASAIPPPAPAGASAEGRIDVSSQKLRCLYLPGVKSSPDAPPPTYIDASNNLLTDVGDNALTGFFLLRYLNLSSNLLHEWGRVPFRDLRSLQLLDVSRNQLRNVDRVVLEPLQALRRLNLSGNRIQYLDGAAFPRLERLHDLDLTRNDMEVIADDAFARLGALQRLDLRWNRLSTLGERTLRGLTAVQSVLLGGNLISEAVPGALQGLNSLSEISLADNGQVVDLVLVGNRLQRVDLSRIGLSAMPAALTRSVRALVLPGNNVRIISCGDLDSFPLLQALELSGNGLALVEDDALGRLEQLEMLVLKNNSLMMIPPSLPESLVTLQLQHNQIRHIGANDLRGLRRLERLDLSHNQVHHIHDGAFRFLESLQELDLSGNKLQELRAAALAGPVGLRVLGLAHLTEITAPAKWLPFPIERPERLQSLDLDQSPQLARQLLADTAALMAMPHLNQLRLASDELHHLRPDLPRLLAHLTHLRLADNPWHCAGLRWLPRWLQVLDAASATNATCRQPAELAGLMLRNLTAAHFNSSQLEDGDEEDPPPPLALPLAGPAPDEEVSIPINEYKRIMIELNKTLAREAAAAAAASSTPVPGLASPTAQPTGLPVNAVNLTSPVETTDAPLPPPVAAALSAAINVPVAATSTAAPSTEEKTLGPTQDPTLKPGPDQTSATPSGSTIGSTVSTPAPASTVQSQATGTTGPVSTISASTTTSAPPTSSTSRPSTQGTPTTRGVPIAPQALVGTAQPRSSVSASTPTPTLGTSTISASLPNATSAKPAAGDKPVAEEQVADKQTVTGAPTVVPTGGSPTTQSNSGAPTITPTTGTPSIRPSSEAPTTMPTTGAPTTGPTTGAPTTGTPSSTSPSTPPSTPPSGAPHSTPSGEQLKRHVVELQKDGGRGALVALRHAGQPAEEPARHDTHTSSVVAMFAVALCCSVAMLLAFAITRNSRHRRQQLLRLHSMEDLVLRGRGPDCAHHRGGSLEHCGPHCGTAAGPELW
ncbi:hypothetical protein FOCC_FOCC016062 [Frankliniella occidentalis]|nr:hypothetical protein FOCC_FOCC016062 [Frankliniella occidentalis]